MKFPTREIFLKKKIKKKLRLLVENCKKTNVKPNKHKKVLEFFFEVSVSCRKINLLILSNNTNKLLLKTNIVKVNIFLCIC